MKIFITGGTGLIGQRLIGTLRCKGCEITVLTRNEEKARHKFGNSVRYCSSLDTLTSLDGYDAVVNLAGESIAGGLWTEDQKEKLASSRWCITRRLSDLIKQSDSPPSVFISGSAIGYYGAQTYNLLTEESVPHNEFIHKLCLYWENFAKDAESERTRVCLLRTGIVLSKSGGLLPKMVLLFRFFLGSVMGTGDQYIAWIHIKDMVDGIVFLLETPSASGAFNMTSPNPATNREFSQTLAEVLHRPCLFRIPRKIVSMVAGEAATLVVDGQRAIPRKLKEENYRFEYPELRGALSDILK